MRRRERKWKKLSEMERKPGSDDEYEETDEAGEIITKEGNKTSETVRGKMRR